MELVHELEAPAAGRLVIAAKPGQELPCGAVVGFIAETEEEFAEAERQAAPLIQELRGRASAIAREEVERTVRRLGEDPDLAKRLDAMAGSIVSKLLHAPSARLRRAVCEGGPDSDLVAAAVQIFDLHPERASRRSA